LSKDGPVGTLLRPDEIRSIAQVMDTVVASPAV